MCDTYLWAIILIISMFLISQTQLGSRFTNPLLWTGASMKVVDNRPGHWYSGFSSYKPFTYMGALFNLDDRPGHEKFASKPISYLGAAFNRDDRPGH
jgi:hypothetical protein